MLDGVREEQEQEQEEGRAEGQEAVSRCTGLLNESNEQCTT